MELHEKHVWTKILNNKPEKTQNNKPNSKFANIIS